MRIGLGLKSRPTVKEMQPLAEPWRPLRGAAAHLWWSYYRAVKKREGVLPSNDEPATKAESQPASNKKPVLNKAVVAKKSPAKGKITPPK
ncbi:hypothetical protein V1291_002125 [Nitrobacteraceae bacterium AZCC 1564]